MLVQLEQLRGPRAVRVEDVRQRVVEGFQRRPAVLGGRVPWSVELGGLEYVDGRQLIIHRRSVVRDGDVDRRVPEDALIGGTLVAAELRAIPVEPRRHL